MLVNTPWIECFMREEAWYDWDGRPGWRTVILFAVQAVPGRALGHWVMTDAGEIRANVPAHALAWKKLDGPVPPLPTVQAWNAQSTMFSLSVNAFLSGLRVLVRLPQQGEGRYMYTLVWHGNEDARASHAENVTESKPFHLIKMDNGLFVYTRNSDARFVDKEFTARKVLEAPKDKYRYDTHEFNCEDVNVNGGNT